MITRRQRRGSTATQVAVSLPVLIAFSAFAVDLSLLGLARTGLQASADAGSLAGVSALDGTSDGLDEAARRAILVTNLHTAGVEPVEITADHVVFGTWDGTDFTPTTVAADVNAVRVIPTSAFSGVFAGAAGFGTLTANAASTSVASMIAVPGSGSGPCGMYSDERSVVSGSVRILGDGACLNSNGYITVSGNVHVDGDVRFGLDPSDYRPPPGGSVTITGDWAPVDEEIDFDPVTVPTSHNNANIRCYKKMGPANAPVYQLRPQSQYIGSDRSFTVSGQGYCDFPPGVYDFKTMTVSGGYEIRVNSGMGGVGTTTEIYLRQGGSLSGNGIENPSADSATLRVQSLGPLTYSGSTTFNGNIYAPGQTVTMSGSFDFYGSAVARELTVSGDVVAYPVALEGVTSSGTTALMMVTATALVE